MTGLAVVTDSSAHLDPGEAASAGVHVVPLTVTIDGEACEETALEYDAFYEQLASGASVTTSLPTPGRLAHAYRSAAAGGATEVVSVHLDARLSGTVNAARLAARQSPIPVTVLDTGTAGFGVGICVHEAARVAAARGSVSDAERAVRALAPAIGNLFVADGAPGQRLGSTPALALLELVDAEARPLELCVSVEAAVAAIAMRVPSRHPLHVAVGHAHHTVGAAADDLARLVASRPQVTDVRRYRVGPAVGAHAGPGSFGIVWWPDRE